MAHGGLRFTLPPRLIGSGVYFYFAGKVFARRAEGNGLRLLRTSERVEMILDVIARW